MIIINNLGIKKLKERAKLIRENKEFAKKVTTILDDDAREKQELDSQMDIYAEESIYKKFPSPDDNKIMPEFHKADWKDKFLCCKNLKMNVCNILEKKFFMKKVHNLYQKMNIILFIRKLP